MKYFLVVFIFLILISACNNTPTQKELEEMKEVDALIKQDNTRQDSAKEVLDSLYTQ